MREVGSGGIDLTDTDDLRAVLGRLAAGTHTQGELELLGRALQAGQITLATGERAVAVGGSMTDAVIITGAGNVVRVFKGADAETVQEWKFNNCPIWGANPLGIRRRNGTVIYARFLSRPSARYCSLFSHLPKFTRHARASQIA